MGKVCFGLIAVFLILQSGCLISTGSGSNKILAISSLEPSTTNVYPKGASDVECVVTAPQGDTIQYKWSTDGGTLTGEGSAVRWEAPADYGDYHVMVTASDNNGNSDEAVLTLSVVPRPVRHCCGRTF
jgi:FlaG/FlaF family flagellin (archaellin)